MQEVTNVILSSYTENYMEKIRVNKHKTVWQNKHLERLKARVRTLFHRAKAHNEWDTYRNALTAFNKEIRKAKQASWRRFCEEVTETPQRARIHRTLITEGTGSQVGFLTKTEGIFTQTEEETLSLLIDNHFRRAETIHEESLLEHSKQKDPQKKSGRRWHPQYILNP